VKSDHFQQVFLNLITNAIDAHDGIPYGTISITTRSEFTIFLPFSPSSELQENMAAEHVEQS